MNAWIVVGFFLFVIVLLVRRQVRRSVERSTFSQKELLRFFSSKERMTGLELKYRIEERTGARRRPDLSPLYDQLDVLVEKKLLLREKVLRSPENAPSLFVTVYFLPPEAE